MSTSTRDNPDLHLLVQLHFKLICTKSTNPFPGEDAAYTRLIAAGYVSAIELITTASYIVTDKGRAVVASLTAHLQAHTRGDFDWHTQIPAGYKGNLHVELRDDDVSEQSMETEGEPSGAYFVETFTWCCWTDGSERWSDGDGNAFTREHLDAMGKAETARFMIAPRATPGR